MTGIRTVPLAMPELVRTLLAEEPGSPALVADGTVLTRGGWLRHASRAAGGLAERAVGPGTPVGVACADWISYAVATAAVYLAGGTVVGLSPRLTEPELLRRLANCAAAGVIRDRPVTGFDGWTAKLADLLGAAPLTNSPEPDPRSLAEILHTSGTTGRPKAVAVTHANLAYGRAARGRFLGPSASTFCAVPLGTNAGHSAVMLALTSPGATHVAAQVDPESVAAAIAREHVESAIVSPWLLQRWLAGGAPDRYDLTSLRTVMLGSSAVPMATVSAFSQRVPRARTLIGYGATEAVPASVHTRLAPWHEHYDPGYYRRHASVGGPGAGTDIRVIDANGVPLGPGQLGEICLRGPAPQRWYHDDPRRSSEVFVDGWVRMGDYGHLDEQGELHFFDRAADVIRRDGELISSSRLDDALLWHPHVAEAAAFAVPDPVAGHRPAAAVVLGSPVPVDELREFVRADFGDVRILPVDSVPRGENGKPLKRQLRVTYAGRSG